MKSLIDWNQEVIDAYLYYVNELFGSEVYLLNDIPHS
jgi:hypothetical protein